MCSKTGGQSCTGSSSRWGPALSGASSAEPWVTFSPLRDGGARLRAYPARARGTFQAIEKYPKDRQPAAGALDNIFMRTRRQGLVLSPDSANCGAACQKRLSFRRALWAYRSLGFGAYRLIHMKCGAIRTLILLFHRSSSYGKTDGSIPLTGRQPKLDEQPG